jgi:tetratricopeptide (TPR) repeat protein
MGSLKNLWKALKPPPAVPRRRDPDALVRISRVRRLWNAIKPPPSVREPSRVLTPDQRRRRRLIFTSSALAILVGGAGWSLYVYDTSAPQRAAAKLQEGMRLAAVGNDAAAIRLYTRALEISPSLNLARFQRGLAHQNLNEQELSVADFEKVVEADPRMGAAHTALGSIYRQRGDSQRAVAEFSRAIDVNGDMDAYYQRGQVYESLGEHEKAIGDYDAAINQMRDAPYVYLARALARENLGDRDGAEQDRKTSLQLQTHNRLVPRKTADQ